MITKEMEMNVERENDWWDGEHSANVIDDDQSKREKLDIWERNKHIWIFILSKSEWLQSFEFLVFDLHMTNTRYNG